MRGDLRVRWVASNPVLVAVLCGVLGGCSKDAPIPLGSADAPFSCEVPTPIVYEAPPPTGKLPWPHHNPSISLQEYASLLNELWVVNNFGLYQQGETMEETYFHDGLDVVLDDGTPIYAVDSGVVRAIQRGDNLIIEDKANPGFAWEYTHTTNFQVEIGDVVPQGACIGAVEFDGLDHIHLSRISLVPGGSWDELFDHNYHQLDTLFASPTTPRR